MNYYPHTEGLFRAQGKLLFMLVHLKIIIKIGKLSQEYTRIQVPQK